jgi:hypothetical protein
MKGRRRITGAIWLKTIRCECERWSFCNINTGKINVFVGSDI